MQMLNAIILLYVQMLMVSIITICFVLVVIARDSSNFIEQAITFGSIAALSAGLFIFVHMF